jgi:nicotinamide-nucleotide adenylyltransferase
MTRLACVTGRFQPVHRQHLELFEIALRDADHLIVAVTNPDAGARRAEESSAHRHLAESNPFTYFERVRMLSAALGHAGLASRSTIVPFDLTRPQCWAEYVPVRARHVVRAYSDWERHKAKMLSDAGYVVTLIDGDPSAKLAASDIRARLGEDPAVWRDLVPEPVAALLTELR